MIRIKSISPDILIEYRSTIKIYSWDLLLRHRKLENMHKIIKLSASFWLMQTNWSAWPWPSKVVAGGWWNAFTDRSASEFNWPL